MLLTQCGFQLYYHKVSVKFSIYQNMILGVQFSFINSTVMKISIKMHYRKGHQLLLLCFLYMYFFSRPAFTEVRRRKSQIQCFVSV